MKEVSQTQYKFYKLLVVIIILVFSVNTPTIAQHELTIRASKDQPIELDFQNASCMALGCYSPNYFTLENIANSEDGQISFEITEIVSNGEKLIISLKGDEEVPSSFS